MKVTSSEAIRNGERELIDAISADLDWGVIEQVFREKHQLGIGDEVEFKVGDIVVQNNQIAYKLQFEVKIGLTLHVDRGGHYLSIAGSEMVEGLEENGEAAAMGEKEKENIASEGEEDNDYSWPARADEDSPRGVGPAGGRTSETAKRVEKTTMGSDDSVDWFDDPEDVEQDASFSAS